MKRLNNRGNAEMLDRGIFTPGLRPATVAAPVAAPEPIPAAVVAPAPSPVVGPVAPPADPYAAIRNLVFAPQYTVTANLGQGNRVNKSFSSEEEAEAFLAELKQATPTARMEESFVPSREQMSTGGFQSKYTDPVSLDAQGNLIVTMQQPGAHKYDTMEAVYSKDPTTGQWVLRNDPMEAKTRQQSSATNMAQGIGTGAAFLLGGAYAPHLSAAMGGGALGGAAAGATIGAGSALAGGASKDEAVKAAITGGVAGGIGGYFSPSTGTAASAGPDVNAMTDAQFNAYLESISPAKTGIGAASSGAASSGAASSGAASSGAASSGAGQVIPVVGNAVPSVVNLPAIASGIGSLVTQPAPVQPPPPPIEVVGNKETPEQREQREFEEKYPVPPTAVMEPTGNIPVPTTTEHTIPVQGNRPPAVNPGAIAGGIATLPTTPSGTPTHNGTGGRLGETATTPEPPQNKFLELAKKNPRLALQMLGMIGGALSGRGGGSAPAPTGPGAQAGFTATQAPKFQRQYVAPPPGYRPGFDPEHKYFTGIGAVGTGG